MRSGLCSYLGINLQLTVVFPARCGNLGLRLAVLNGLSAAMAWSYIHTLTWPADLGNTCRMEYYQSLKAYSALFGTDDYSEAISVFVGRSAV